MRIRPDYLAVGGLVALLALFMGALGLYGHFSTAILAPQPVAIQVRTGETLSQLTARLGEQGVLRNPRAFMLFGILRGDSANIKAGEYVMQGAVTPAEVLDSLVSGRARYVSFTVPEGFSLAEIAARVEARELGRAERFLTLSRDRDFIATLDLPVVNTPATLEGFLYPETYYFHRGVGAEALIRAMVEQFKRRTADLLADRAESVGMTPYQVLILASMVEKETGVAAERPLIAAVFHNRLRARMRLASDPTVIYGIADFDGNLRRADLLAETPYNTYKIAGLPPTPIANPGLESIAAVLSPAPVPYLYFVARGDGTHEFSRDYRAHQDAVYKYQIRPHRRRSS